MSHALAPLCALVDCSAVSVSALSNSSKQETKHRRRYCKYEGCTRIVKSQGLCQRHGAKPRKCKIDGCNKQAQGNFNCMCKAHFKELKKTEEASSQAMNVVPAKFPTSWSISTMLPIPPVATPAWPEPVKSVCETILMDSLGWNPAAGVMPLIAHLKQGFDISKPEAWHRNEERQVRGLAPISSVSQDFESWEIELAWMETLVLTGNADASFQHLARAWGQAKDFHLALGNTICAGNLQARPEFAATLNADSVKSTGSEDSTGVDSIYDESLVDDVIEIFLPKESHDDEVSGSSVVSVEGIELLEPEIFPSSLMFTMVGSSCSGGRRCDYFTRSTVGMANDWNDIPASVQFTNVF